MLLTPVKDYCALVEKRIPGFPDQVDHSPTTVRRHTNYTKFRIRSCHDQLENHIWSRIWSGWNHTTV